MLDHQSEIAGPGRVPHFLRTQGAWKLLLAIPAFLVAGWVSIYLPTIGIPLPPTLTYLVLGAIVVLAGVEVYRSIRVQRKAVKDQLQAERDQFAAAVLEHLAAGLPAPAFTLYLRPFFTDNYLVQTEPRFAAFYLPGWVRFLIENSTQHFERALADAVSPEAPLIALGYSEEEIGGGRIYTDDENWRSIFDLLIASAARIVIVPLGQASTMTEIVTIAENPDLLSKTVFVRPAETKHYSFNFGPDESIKSVSGMWNWTREKVRSLLPEFPDFRGGPRLFAIDAQGRRVDCFGDGQYSIHQAKGIRPFVVDGVCKTRAISTILLFAPLLAISNLFSHLALHLSSSDIDIMTALLSIFLIIFVGQGLVGSQFPRKSIILYTIAIIPLILLGWIMWIDPPSETLEINLAYWFLSGIISIIAFLRFGLVVSWLSQKPVIRETFLLATAAKGIPVIIVLPLVAYAVDIPNWYTTAKDLWYHLAFGLIVALVMTSGRVSIRLWMLALAFALVSVAFEYSYEWMSIALEQYLQMHGSDALGPFQRKDWASSSPFIQLLSAKFLIESLLLCLGEAIRLGFVLIVARVCGVVLQGRWAAPIPSHSDQPNAPSSAQPANINL